MVFPSNNPNRMNAENKCFNPFHTVQMYVDSFTIRFCPESRWVCGMQIGLDDLSASLA